MIPDMDRGNSGCSSILAALMLLGVGTTICAQGLVPYNDANAGIALRAPKWMQSAPPKTGDRQVLAQFEGTQKSTAKDFRRDVDLQIWVVRIERQKAATTGDKDKPENPKSFADMKLAQLNSGTNLGEFLQHRDREATIAENAGYFGKKPLSDPDGHPFKVFESRNFAGNATTWVSMLAFLTETDAEYFGLVAMGDGATAFENEVLAVLKTLHRISPDTKATEDPYANSALRGLDRRRQVRAELVPGWHAVDTENYIVVTNVKTKIIDDICIDLEVMRNAYMERFPPAEGADMSAVSTVRVCDGYDDFLGYAGKESDGLGGYWSPLEEELVIFNPEKKVPTERPWLKGVEPLDVLHHEAMHQYFHYSNRQLSPASWFNEGYGEVFGGCDVDRKAMKIKRFRTNSFRMKWIREMRKRPGAPDLATMMRATQAQFYYNGGVMENYANAWSFCYFLEQERQKPEGKRNEKWAQLPQRYLQHLREATDKVRANMPKGAPDDWIMGFEDEIQDEAIKATLGEIDAEELEKAWLKAQTTLK